MDKLPVSLVIVTLNEEKNIERCIQSVPFANDVVVIDSGSTDRTVELARNLGARVRVEPWRGYQKQKTRAVALALNHWIISLDADEALSPEAALEIRDLLSQGENQLADGYDLPRLTFHLGKWIYHGGWYPDRQVRFFHREKCRWMEGDEKASVVGEKIAHIKGDIFHWSFETLADQIETMNKHSSLSASDFSVRRDSSYSLSQMFFGPPKKFVEVYFLKAGYRDGIPGFIIAAASAFSAFLHFAKIWEQLRLSTNETSHLKK